MTFFITALGLTISLVFFGVIIGFSPVLYAMVARYSVDRRRHMLAYATIGGVTLAVTVLFAIGGGITSLIHEVWMLLRTNQTSRAIMALTLGTGLLAYVALQRFDTFNAVYQKTVREKQAVARFGKMHTVGIMLFAFGKTVAKASAVAAVVIASAMLIPYAFSDFFVWFFALPVLCAAAIAPYVLILVSERIAPKTRLTVTKVTRRIALQFHRYEYPVDSALAFAGCGLLIYGMVFALTTP